MLRNYVYTCKDCSHSWVEARVKQYANVPVELGCVKCSSKNIEYTLQNSSTTQKSSGPSIVDSCRAGVTKTPDGFKDVLRKIKHRNPGSTIDV